MAAGEKQYQTFSPADIIGYRLTDNGKYYVSRTIELNNKKEVYFLEYLIKGIISLYYLYNEETSYFFFENEQGQMYSTCVTDDNGEIGGAGNWRQRRMQIIRPIFEAFQESPDTQRKLMESNLDKRNLSELTRGYHNRICTSAEECVKFEYDKNEILKAQTITYRVGYKF